MHRDLKPENLFLPSEGGLPLKVLDFGLSRVIDVGARLTAVGATIGTPRYMAPEQILSARDAIPAVDVYALGVCAYEALAGASPFDAADQAQLLGAILHGRRVPLRVRRPELPAAVEAVLDKAMSAKAAARHMSAVELAAALYRAARITPDADLPRAVARAAYDAPAAPERLTPVHDPRTPDPVARARAEADARAQSSESNTGRLRAYEEPLRFSSVPTPPVLRVPAAGGPSAMLWVLYAVGALVRLRETAPQAGLDARRRVENVQGAFAVSPRARLAGLRVLVLDDVRTTGATLAAACEALLAARVAEARTLTLAIAERHS